MPKHRTVPIKELIKKADEDVKEAREKLLLVLEERNSIDFLDDIDQKLYEILAEQD